MSARKSSHGTIFLIVSSGSPLALIASSLRSISKKPVCPMTRSLHPPMAHCNQRVRFAATWREEFFEVPLNKQTCVSPPRGSLVQYCFLRLPPRSGGSSILLQPDRGTLREYECDCKAVPITKRYEKCARRKSACTCRR